MDRSRLIHQYPSTNISFRYERSQLWVLSYVFLAVPENEAVFSILIVTSSIKGVIVDTIVFGLRSNLSYFSEDILTYNTQILRKKK